MRHLTATEKGVLALAALLIVCGVWAALFPSESTDVHPAYRTGKVSFPAWVQHISTSDARIYGALAGVAGSGLIWLVLYRGTK